jgi:hypothetical protein
MTTRVKQRGSLRRWIGRWIFHLLDLKSPVVAVVEAAQWDMMTPCVICGKDIKKHDAYCHHCGEWQEALNAKQDTTPLYSIELENKGRLDRLFFQRSHITGQLQINGERPWQAYRKTLREQMEEEDSWTWKDSRKWG